MDVVEGALRKAMKYLLPRNSLTLHRVYLTRPKRVSAHQIDGNDRW